MVGCAVLRRLDERTGEIKRLWIDPPFRNRGVARFLLALLEQAALARGIDVVRLDTHKVLDEAINLYRSAGYMDRAPHGKNVHAHLWFEKRIRAKS